MSESTLERLFWEELDGPPSAERQRRIEALVEERPERRLLLTELQSLASAFEAAREMPVPLELRAAVRQAVAGRPRPRARRRASLAQLFRPLVTAPPRVRFAWATLAALAVGVALFATFGWPPAATESSRLSGALNVGLGQPAEVITVPGSGAELRLTASGRRVSLDLDPAELAPLWVGLEGAALELVGIDGPAALDAAGGGALRVLAEGPVRLELELQEGAAALSLRLSSATSETLLERQIELR